MNRVRSDAHATTHRLRVTAAAALIASVALAGCSQGANSINITAHDDVELGDAVMAAYLSPQTFEWSEFNDTGYVVLIDSDGEARSIETSGMDTNQMVWDENGLHFSDTEHDYLLDKSGLHATKSPKTNLQMSMHTIGTSAVSVYNEGKYAKDSYRMTVVEHDGKRSSSEPAEGMLTGFAQCGEAIYATGMATGPQLKDYRSSIDRSQGQKVLARLWPGPQEIIAGADTNPEDFEYFDDAPCVDDTIYYLTTAQFGKRDADGVRPTRAVLVKWSVSTGKRTERILRDTNGDLFPSDKLEFASYDARAIRSGAIVWTDGSGKVFETELANGTTRGHSTVANVPDNSDAIYTLQTESSLYAVEVPYGPQDQIIITRHSLEGGTTEELLRTNDKFTTDTGAVLRDVALSPALLGQ
ncbi:hypothetical protein [Myceligenerans crystallogenes]|uniref:Lipoprotein n=1 Tax=Myceligenerans crystallogenes TaxID=316335 RepID=A0ABN2N2K6_9MICO